MKVLGRLAPKTLVPTGEGFGGFMRLEQCDVAMALAGLPSGPAALMRAMYSLDHGEANIRDLKLWAWQEGLSIAMQHGWQLPRGREIVRKLSARCVDELTQPSLTNCPHCRGTGHVQPNQHNTDGVCRLCDQTGYRVPPSEEMADLIGVTVDDWDHVWGPRYVRIYGAILAWHAQAAQHIARKLR